MGSSAIQALSLYWNKVGSQPAVAAAELYAWNPIKVSFRSNTDATAVVETFMGAGLTIDLMRFSEPIIPGSVAFTLGGKNYFDRNGVLHTNLNVVSGISSPAGTVNYLNGEVVLSLWEPGSGAAVTLKSLLTSMDKKPVDHVSFRIPAAPVRPGSFQVLATKAIGGLINVTADTDGFINTADVRGQIDYETGVVNLRFGQFVLAAGKESQPWFDATSVSGGYVFEPRLVYADSIRYNAVAFTYLPLDADILGLDPVRLPQDGRVPIFRTGGFSVIGNTKSITATVGNGQVIDCARVRLSRVRIVGATGLVINTGYSANLEAGTVTFTDVSSYAQPVKIEHRIEDMVQVSDVQINGQLGFTRRVTHDYPVQDSYVSSALVSQDLKARVSIFFDQGSWDGVAWVDAPVGNPATATFNEALSPVLVTNIGAVTERWTLRFTNNTTFDIIGEHVGGLGIGSVNTLTAPINPATGAPYFTINALGWGVGWSAGNVIRMNTVGAMFPVWVVRTIQQGAESVQDDSFSLLVRGDVDRP